MPGMCLPIEDGGIGFDYRLAMGLPDMWIKNVKKLRDEQWDLDGMWKELSFRQAKTVAYLESHDQALVGDQTMMFRLAADKMYTEMQKDVHTDIIDRATALHKMMRLITAMAGGEAYLAFMGNEFGHPEWIEFPKKENELPDNIVKLVKNDLIEILWVYENCKCFKKVLFTLDKYRKTPVISADDDAIYLCNYAEILYQAWTKNKSCIITNEKHQREGYQWVSGINALYPPYVFKDMGLKYVNLYKIKPNDDAYTSALIHIMKLNIFDVQKPKFFKFHTTKNALSKTIKYSAIPDIERFIKKIKE